MSTIFAYKQKYYKIFLLISKNLSSFGRLYEMSNGYVTRIVNSYDEMGREKNVSKIIDGSPAVYTIL